MVLYDWLRAFRFSLVWSPYNRLKFHRRRPLIFMRRYQRRPVRRSGRFQALPLEALEERLHPGDAVLGAALNSSMFPDATEPVVGSNTPEDEEGVGTFGSNFEAPLPESTSGSGGGGSGGSGGTLSEGDLEQSAGETDPDLDPQVVATLGSASHTPGTDPQDSVADPAVETPLSSPEEPGAATPLGSSAGGDLAPSWGEFAESSASSAPAPSSSATTRSARRRPSM